MNDDLAPTTWPAVEATLLDQVFYAWPSNEVRAAVDLADAGMVDSLSVIAILEVLVEATGNEAALGEATADDFRSLPTIHALFDRL